jgi:hypothetical protein
VCDLHAAAASLGLSVPLVQQWVAGDVSCMVSCLQQRQQAAAAAQGLQLYEVRFV